MDIGKESETIVIEPIKNPVPEKETAPEPVKVPA